MTSTAPPAPPAEITVTEAADRYGIKKRALQGAIRRGQVPARKVGPVFVLDPEAARLYGEVFKARRAFNAYVGRDDSDDDE